MGRGLAPAFGSYYRLDHGCPGFLLGFEQGAWGSRFGKSLLQGRF